MRSKKNIWNIVIVLILSLLAGCGSSSTDSNTSNVYNVEYIESTSPVQGKTTFQLRITKQSDNSAATGLHPQVQLTMSGMGHGTPIDSIAESGTPGYYDCTVYYLMGGTWEMKVTVGDETTTFNPAVASSMSVTTKLYGADDVITGMSGTTYNKYYIFRDGMVNAAAGTLNLYISHSENMMMDFKAVSDGSVLSAPTGTVVSMVVSASTNTSFASPSTGVDNGNGHWSLSGISGLVSGQTATIYVKLNVNGQDKTTDGQASSGTNAYATYTVMPQ